MDFATHRAAIAALPAAERLSRDELLNDEFLLAEDGRLEIYYAPFDAINPSARIALVGITPGWQQHHDAFVAVRRLLDTVPDEALLAAAKASAAFSGPLRANLVSMLDGIGVARAVGIDTTARLWDTHTHLLHATSAVRNPVYRNGANYAGRSPAIERSPILVPYVDVLAAELGSVRALTVPLGKAAEAVVAALAERGTIGSDQVLWGFPHPSGGNAHRVRQFAEMRDKLESTVAAWCAA